MVTSYVGPHSCIPFGLRGDGKMMDSNFVASEIVGRLRQKHTAPIDELWEIIRSKYDHELSYYKVWDAKQKAIAKIFGDWEESYQRLQKLLLAYLDQDSGTQYNYHTIPRPNEGTALLRYVYWAFVPCIAVFQYCRPVISIDGTHLYGKYKGVLMIAMATNINQKFLPLTFAVVDKESGASCGWFLECLRTSIEHACQMVAFALFLTDIKVSNVPFESGLEVRMEENGFFTDIAFDMLLATSTHTLMT